ncbi:MAG: hypothetical protein ACC633_04220 [Anaerolineales bacterium]
MFTTSLAEYKIKQNELHNQAEKYRLVKSLEKPNPVFSRIVNALGKLLIQSGQHLISRVQTAH